MNAQARLARSVLVFAAVLGLGTGCGGTLEDPPLESLQQEATQEEPRKIEDLMGALDRQARVLHVVDQLEQLVLSQLKAERVSTSEYVHRDELTGDVTRFTVSRYPETRWPLMFRYCPSTQQYVPSTIPCPSTIYTDSITRIWRNASCNRQVQAAGWSACVNSSSGTSYNLEYRQAWRCGTGTGFCVERRAVRTVRYDYDLAACNPAVVTNIAPTAYDFLCAR